MACQLVQPGSEELPVKCPNCGKGPFIRDEESGELVCQNCGYVLLERAEDARPGNSEARGKADIASPLARPDMGLSTTIGRADRDAAGASLSGKSRSAIERLRVWDRRSQPRVPGIRGMGRAFDEIRTVAKKLSLSEGTVEQAAYIYRKSIERGITRGRSTSGLAAAALYAACREAKIPRSLKDVASAANVQMKGLTRSYRVIVNSLDMRMPVEDPAASLAKIGSALGAPPRVMRRAKEILDRANEKGLSAGKEPMAQAGAALYLASQLEGRKGETQKKVAKAAEVTEATLRARYKNLRGALGYS
jgi:transcription initiation factor TFIIB